MTARAESTALLERPDTDPSPLRADGIELVGEYEGSGYKEPHFLARRSDGQVIQLTELLFHVADACDGDCTWEEIAERVSERYGKTVSVDDIRYLVTEKLRPLGLLVDRDGSQPDVAKADPMLALRFRVGVVSPERTAKIAALFKPLFWPPMIVALLAAFVAMDVWFFGHHGVGGGMRELLYRPATIILLYGLLVVGTAFHELGHAAGCLYGGARPGRMGAGIYLVWPAFFTDVTDSYRLGRRGRLRTDLGGVYFNVVFALATCAVYAATGFEPLLVMIGIQHLEILHQLLPFLRLDGYYVLADATGVPDLFNRIKPIFRSLVPWKSTDAKVHELKPWVRVAVTGWVLLLVPLLAYMFGTMVINAPRVIATGADSFAVQWAKTGKALSAGDVLSVLTGVLQLITLLLPSLGIVVMIQRLVRTTATKAWTWSDGSAPRRGLVGVALAGAAVFAAFTLWPNGEYRPLQKSERLTVGDTVRQFRYVDTGRPGLTPAEQKRLRGAPAIAERVTSPPAATTDETTTSADETTTTTAPDATGSAGDQEVSTTTSVRTTSTTEPDATTTTTEQSTTTTTSSSTTETTAP